MAPEFCEVLTTDLMWSARRGKVWQVRLALLNHSSGSSSSRDGVDSCHGSMVFYLFSCDWSELGEKKLVRGASALWLAVREGHLEVARELIDVGKANVNHR